MFRRAVIPAIVCAWAIVAPCEHVWATTCAEPEYRSPTDAFFPLPDHTPRIEVPVDAQPWYAVACGDVEGPIELALDVPFDCEFVAEDGERIALELDAGPDGFTPEDCQFQVPDLFAFAVVRLIPERELHPATTYHAECRSNPLLEPPLEQASLVTRASLTPAAALPTLEPSVEAHPASHTGCCGRPNRELEIELMGLDPAFLLEGGYIEARARDGTQLLVTRAGFGHPFNTDGRESFLLPALEGGFTLTPVSIEGTRGESVTVAEEEAGCAIARSSLLPSFWSLVVLTLLLARRKRTPLRETDSPA